MYSTQNVTPGITWVGGNDRRLERFENMFPLPGGVSYNSYLIQDEKTALMDTVDAAFAVELMDNLNRLLGEKPIDYLVITHMEPDHSAAIAMLCEYYPEMKLVGSAKALELAGQFFEADWAARYQPVAEGDELNLGAHTLRFYAAPMVHWPEVLFAYETSEKILFSSDAFGTFGALNGNLFADEVDYECVYLDEARRYYANIVGKYGTQVQNVLKKLAGVEITTICPLHGPIWRQDLPYILEKYGLWSTYQPEKQGVVVAYGSMYGHTEAAATLLANELATRGIGDIRMYDVSKTHPSYIISELFKYSHLVLAAPTYNMGVYLPMDTLLHDMAALNVQSRKVALIGNGSWAPAGLAIMQKSVEAMKDMEILGEPLLVRSAFKPQQLPALRALADTVAASIKG